MSTPPGTGHPKIGVAQGQRVKRSLDRVPVTTDVYTLGLERVAYVLDNFDKIRIHFSGGKDSTAVLNLVLDVVHSDPKYARHLPVKTVFFDEEAIPTETSDYVARVAARDDVDLEWWCVPVQHRNACSRRHPYWWPWAPEDEPKWCRPLPEQAITAHPKFTAWPPSARPTVPQFAHALPDPPHSTALFMGIRAQESFTRLRAVTAKKLDNYISPAEGSICASKVYPIYDWSVNDVWTGPRALGWDYNRAYDVMSAAGIGGSLQRCSPAFGEEPLQKIGTFAACFPDVWQKMCERVPGIGAAHRYALTELYGYRTIPEKPRSMPWPEYIARYVAKFDPDVQAGIAERLKVHIRQHYRAATAPILKSRIHPLTGVAWRTLTAVAMRGDFKNRRQASTNFRSDIGTSWRQYAVELADTIESGYWDDLCYPGTFPTDPLAVVPEHQREQCAAAIAARKPGASLAVPDTPHDPADDADDTDDAAAEPGPEEPPA